MKRTKPLLAFEPSEAKMTLNDIEQQVFISESVNATAQDMSANKIPCMNAAVSGIEHDYHILNNLQR